MLDRETAWGRLAAEGFDLLVIGGGITGAAALRDAARRGLRVALVDAGDFACGTSSRSSKLVHGGLRYLEQREFSLVFESVSERRILMNIAPHLVEPLGFVFPVYEDSPVGVKTLQAGLWLYDALSLFRSPKMHSTMSAQEAIAAEPLLRPDGLKGCPLYYDCATDDARLTFETLLDGVEQGGVACNYARATALLRDEGGRICGARVRDGLGGRELDLRATVVINGAGPWADRVRALGGGGQPMLRTTKGVHVVVDAERLPLRHAVVCNHPADRRVLFAIPWGDRTYVGTTDTDYDGDPAEVAATRQDVDYLVEAARAFFPSAGLCADDVMATWAGVRPLIREAEVGPSAVSREHRVAVDPDGLITIAGGKLTTCRRMGREVVHQAIEMMVLLGRLPEPLHDAHTGREPLPGAVGWPEDDDRDAVADAAAEASSGTLDRAACRHLVDRYGMRGLDVARALGEGDPGLRRPLVPGRPELLGLVDHAVRHEMACTVTDFLVRRTQLFFRDAEQGLGAAPAVADRMGELLGWSERRRTEELLAYQEEVAKSRRWRTE